MISKQNAKSLAITYHAYLKANDHSDDNGLVVWGGMLIADQRATGIELQDEARIVRIIEQARRRLKEAA